MAMNCASLLPGTGTSSPLPCAAFHTFRFPPSMVFTAFNIPSWTGWCPFLSQMKLCSFTYLVFGRTRIYFSAASSFQSTFFTVLMTKPKSTLPQQPCQGGSPARDTAAGKGLCQTQEQCPSLLDPVLTATLLHSGIRFYIFLQHLLSAWKRWNRIKPTPNSFTLWCAQPKEGNR